MYLISVVWYIVCLSCYLTNCRLGRNSNAEFACNFSFCFQEVEQPKVSVTKAIKQEPKASSSLPSGNNNGKPTTSEKVKKETEKRSADKVSWFSSLVK